PASPGLRETSSAASPKPKLLDRVRHAVRARHYSRRTEKAYVHWIKRYIFFHDRRHPAEMGAAEVTAFLTALAVRDKVAASTQNQALAALLFLYRVVLGVELPWLDEVVHATRPQYLPVVLTRDEVRHPPGPQRRAAAHGRVALRCRAAFARVLPSACKGRRFRNKPDRDPRR